mmetsp:Transcript_61580/g.146901  ORF Transcript_61580/g.146901 Transcript_61580/m.146901 type:complete len:473 (+) Transcript_61580:173-1591(+)
MTALSFCHWLLLWCAASRLPFAAGYQGFVELQRAGAGTLEATSGTLDSTSGQHAAVPVLHGDRLASLAVWTPLHTPSSPEATAAHHLRQAADTRASFDTFHRRPKDTDPYKVSIPPWWERSKNFVNGGTQLEITMAVVLALLFICDHFVVSFHHKVGAWVAAGLWFLVGLAIGLGQLAVLSNDSLSFLSGWLFQMLCGLEDLFIFHVVMETFGAKDFDRYVAMVWVAIAQVLFQFAFMVELQYQILRITWLPYVLGIWLLIIGSSALMSGDDHSYVDVSEGMLVQGLRRMLGRRFSNAFEEGACITGRQGVYAVSMLLPMTAYCIGLDIMFEADTTVTKIEAYGGGFDDFLSSMAAALAIPHWYFVALAIFRRFPLMKYGIATILIYFAFELLFKDLISIPAAGSAAALLGIVGFTILYSFASGNYISGSLSEEAHKSGGKEQGEPESARSQAKPEPAAEPSPGGTLPPVAV